MKKIKLNWGTGILITFIVFMASVLIQVFFYMNTKVDLVTDNYYEKEMVYEDHLSKVRNTGELTEEVEITYSGREIKIAFPEGRQYTKIKGSLLFYRPSDSSRDFTLNLEPGKNLVQTISTQNISSGYWIVKMNWEYENVSYYNEKPLLID
jgi:hypothetical protein